MPLAVASPSSEQAQAAVAADEREGVHRSRVGRHADDDHRALKAQHAEVLVVVVRGGDGVDDQVELARELLERLFVAGDRRSPKRRACARRPPAAGALPRQPQPDRSMASA